MHFLMQLCVLKVKSDWSEEAQSTKDALKYATAMPGVQSVMMDLGPMMQMLLVDSLDCLEVVSINSNI